MDVLEAIIELENFYGKKLSDYVYLLYKERLEKLEPERLRTAIANTICAYPCKGNFFPSVEMIFELVTGRPVENSTAYQEFQKLPSEVMRLTPDECLANQKKLLSMLKGVGGSKAWEREGVSRVSINNLSNGGQDHVRN